MVFKKKVKGIKHAIMHARNLTFLNMPDAFSDVFQSSFKFRRASFFFFFFLCYTGALRKNGKEKTKNTQNTEHIYKGES